MSLAVDSDAELICRSFARADSNWSNVLNIFRRGVRFQKIPHFEVIVKIQFAPPGKFAENWRAPNVWVRCPCLHLRKHPVPDNKICLHNLWISWSLGTRLVRSMTRWLSSRGTENIGDCWPNASNLLTRPAPLSFRNNSSNDFLGNLLESPGDLLGVRLFVK